MCVMGIFESTLHNFFQERTYDPLQAYMLDSPTVVKEILIELVQFVEKLLPGMA